jgi:hemolysin III
MGFLAEHGLDHYPNPAEKLADWWVHAVGLTGAVAGGLVLVVLSAMWGGAQLAGATGLYAVCLVGMLACSAVYNQSRASTARPLLRRLDEAAIFVMIAGSYTPFTTQRLTGGWAIGMTAAVWAIALAGAAAKLFPPRLPDRLWTLAYVVFGWLSVIAIGPLVSGVPMVALVLLVVGGLLYSAGTLVFHSRLPFRRAIWHGFVVGAAGLHFAAVWTGVVLAAPR